MATQKKKRPTTYKSKKPAAKKPAGAAYKKRRKKAPKIHPAAVVIILALVLVLSAAGALFALSQGDSTERIIRGVTVNGINLAGMTYGQVIDTLQPHVDRAIAESQIIFTYRDQSWTYGGQDIGMESNISEVAYQALELALDADGKRDRDEVRRIAQEGVAFDIQYRYNSEKLSGIFSDISGKLGLPPDEPEMYFNPDPAGDEEMFTIHTGQAGERLHHEEAMAAFSEQFVYGQSLTMELPISYEQNEERIAFLKRCQTPLCGEFENGVWVARPFRTQVRGTKSRQWNVDLAMRRLNGMEVKPGQTVSFNETTGERSAENGYEKAPGIAGDYTTDLTYGGGACQVSTMLYNGALLAGCEMVERNKHSVASTYVWKGFDAMVNWPNSDFKFKNSSQGPMYIRAWCETDDEGRKYAYIMFYGLPLENNAAIEREQRIVETIPAPVDVETRPDTKGEHVTYEDETYELRKASEGVRVEAWLIYKDKDTGAVLDEVRLHTDKYKEYGSIILYGVTKRPSTPAPTNGGD